MATPTGCYTYSELNRMRYEEFQRAEIRAKTEAKVRERENMLENIRLKQEVIAKREKELEEQRKQFLADKERAESALKQMEEQEKQKKAERTKAAFEDILQMTQEEEEKRKKKQLELEKEKAYLRTLVDDVQKVEDKEKAAEKQKLKELQDSLIAEKMAVERRRKEDKEKAKQEELKLLQETEEHAETQERKRIEAEKERLEKINLRVTKYMSLPQKPTWKELAIRDEEAAERVAEEQEKEFKERERQERERKRKIIDEYRVFLAEQLGKHTQKVQRGVPDDLLIKRQETEEDLKRARLAKQRELKALLDDQVQEKSNFVQVADDSLTPREAALNANLIRQLEEFRRSRTAEAPDGEAKEQNTTDEKTQEPADEPCVNSEAVEQTNESEQRCNSRGAGTPTTRHQDIMRAASAQYNVATTVPRPASRSSPVSPKSKPATPKLPVIPRPNSAGAMVTMIPIAHSATPTEATRPRSNADKRGRPHTSAGKLAPMLPQNKPEPPLSTTL